ncbi:MAG: hypothetical protein LUD44_01735 [Firmicutes bacterium]|nr:hypothetical protein [Bacillota bacterium]
MERQYSFSKFLLCILVAILAVMNVFTQLMGSSAVSLAVTFLTIALFVLNNAWNELQENIHVNQIVLLFAAVIIYSFISGFIGKNYQQMLRAEVICFASLLIGSSFFYIYKKEIYIALKTFCFFITISCIYYMFTYSSLGAYGYALKNNFSPMILFSVLILHTLRKEWFRHQAIAWIVILFQIFVIFSTDCRSVAVTTLAFIIWFGIQALRKIKSSSRNYLLGAVFIVVLIFVFRNQLSDLIYSGLRLGILEESGAEKYSANRIPMIINGMTLWSESVFNVVFGASSGSYVECFYVDTLVYRGFIGLVAFVALFIKIIKELIYCISSTVTEYFDFSKIGLYVFIAGLMIGIFEAGAPFVQGSTYFIMWFLIGTTFSCPEAGIMQKDE